MTKYPIKYPNTPSNGLIFSHFVQMGGVEIDDWDDYLAPYLRDISQKTVLDLGCGFGSNFICFLKRRNYYPKRLIHLDVDPGVFLRENSSQGSMIPDFYVRELFYDWKDDTKLVADVGNLPLEDRCVDIIHQDMVYDDNPILDVDRAYKEIKRVLRKGGFYITGDTFTNHIGDKQNFEYDGYFEELDLGFPPRNVYCKIKD